jgi:DNA-directed RNA polymerase specialized sigma24 family protein
LSLADLFSKATAEYDEKLAEEILQQYINVYSPVINRLCALGEDRDDLIQELRIALWKAWTRWDGRIGLRRWVSWKLRWLLHEIERKAISRAGRLRIVRLP